MNAPRTSSPTGIEYLCAATASVVALAVIIGWAADVNTLKTVLPGFPEMKPVGAGGFLLLAVGLFLAVQDANDRRFRWGTPVAGGITAVAAAIILGKYLFQVSNDIAAVLIPDLGPVAGSPGSKISPVSAIGFIFLGISVALMRSRRFSQISGTLAVLALITAYAAALGHLFHADTFYGFSGINGVPLHTAFLFFVVGAGLLWNNREFHLMRLIGSDSLGGTAARRLIPSVVVISTTIVWLRMAGQERGLYDAGFGAALATLTLVIITLAIVLFFSRTIHLADQQRRIAESELADKERRYRELFDYSQGLICIHDIDGRLGMVNRASHTLLGYTEEEMVGRNLRDLVPAKRQQDFDAYLRKVTNEGLADGLLELESKSGKRVILRYYNVLATEKGREPYVLGHAQDVTELLDAQQQLKNMSLTDEMTGLYNRRGFVTLAEQQIKLEMHNGTARGLIMMFADMDGLKAINDTYGHEAGSKALVTLARLLKATVRGADLVARWGGDEFVILSIGAHGEDCQLVVERIHERLDEYNAESRDPYLIACSIGLVPIDLDARKSFEEIIAEADAAMYAEKKRRKAAYYVNCEPPPSFIRQRTEAMPRS